MAEQAFFEAPGELVDRKITMGEDGATVELEYNDGTRVTMRIVGEVIHFDCNKPVDRDPLTNVIRVRKN